MITVICSVIFSFFFFFFCLNSVELNIIYSRATLNLFLNSYLSFFGLLFFGLLIPGCQIVNGKQDKTKFATRRHTRFGCIN